MTKSFRDWAPDLLLILILVVGAYFRLIGLNWDDNQHLHPDERFLTMVETSLQVKKCAQPNTSLPACPPDQVTWITPADYLRTATSTLNPQNQGYTFFVYGDLPIVMVRYLAEWFNQTGYDQVNLLGRQVSALGDLFTILVVYLIASKLYDRRVGLLTAAFSALAVLQIQQSHFFVVDTVANLFIFLALYCAVQIVLLPVESPVASPGPLTAAQLGGSVAAASSLNRLIQYVRNRLFLYSLCFGAALGAATASKLNAAPLAVVLPIAFVVRYLTLRNGRLSGQSDQASPAPQPDPHYWSRVAVFLVAGALASILVFRITQPYAFQGLGLNPAWIGNITELQSQSNGNADVPFALQWARRSHLFSFENLTTWGLGLPLGILAWIGFLWMLWRIFNGKWKHAVLWSWTALYFGWQSTVFNPTMRYQLPVYPLLCMMAAWFVLYLWDQRKAAPGRRFAFLYTLVAGVIAGSVLVLTFAWAYAFTRIYTRPVTRVAATHWIYQNIPAAINLQIATANGSVYDQPIPFQAGTIVGSGDPFSQPFRSNASGTLTALYFPHVAVSAAADAAASSQSFSVSIVPQAGPSANQPDSGTVTGSFSPGSDGRGTGYTLTLDRPLPISQGETYTLNLVATTPLALVGAAPINESDWDDGLPLRLGPEGYDGYGGLYQGGLNLQIYWDDNSDKLKRYVDTLTQGDYIFMSSNRQWATTTRVPERYPLTTAYYRDLVGCPPDKDVIWCYNVATPGMFQGQLGYKLVAVFESFPTLNIPGLLNWQANDQFAEEAFTVYDHPKVLIFQKQPDFSPDRVQQLLGAVDLTNVVHLTPAEAGGYKNLMLSPVQLAIQRAGGTWSQIFSYSWVQNSIPALGLLFWYLFVLVLGLLTYPIIRLALPGLGDKGYPLSRFLGLVLLGYFSWLSGSAGVPVTRITVAVVFAVIAIVGLTLAWRQRAELAQEWKSRRLYFVMAEGMFLAFFAFDLLIRIGNPDLWHPAKGGERPMDFSFFNAVIKSTSFPPYDPWFAGGYINYYYYGFVLMAMPVKLLGIVPTLAYNFILPTLYAMVAMGAFCVGWNLLDGIRQRPDPAPADAPEAAQPTRSSQVFDFRFFAGLLAALLMVVLGNLGTVRMIYQGLQEMAAPGGNIDNVSIPQRIAWAVQGAGHALSGEPLPYGPGNWYWDPSRVIPPGPGNEITEFPFFTFLYSDLHAHMMAMPVALLALAWALSVIRRRRLSLFSLIIGALVIGALYPTNLSDIYTYLPLAFAVITYAVWRGEVTWHRRFGMPDWAGRLLLNLGSIALVTALAYGLYEPYRLAYSQGYGTLDSWTTSHTPIWSYLTHWGVFLFIITGWLAWETHEWLASTPVSSLNKLRPYQVVIDACVAGFLVGLVYLAYRQVEIGWVALPIAAWAGLLMLRPGMPDLKRFVLFLVGTSMLITIVVEIEVVHGDIGRMNTIFKFYLQAWAFLSVSAGAAIAWLLPEFRRWQSGWRNFFQAGVVVLLSGAALFTITGTTGKLSDRMAPNVPLTLDSITYMQYAQYADFNVTMNLVQDYQAIRWMQDHIQGSPVIVEANCPEYRWCSRFTIYTGLPGVVGWNWHERQQRTLDPQDVEARVSDVGAFYMTPDSQAAEAFLRKYSVRYIVVGQLEQAEYAGAGLDKFAQLSGQLWDVVYQQGDTTIYQVRP